MSVRAIACECVIIVQILLTILTTNCVYMSTGTPRGHIYTHYSRVQTKNTMTTMTDFYTPLE